MKKTPKEIAKELGIPIIPPRKIPRKQILSIPKKDNSLPYQKIPKEVCGVCGEIKYEEQNPMTLVYTPPCENPLCPYESGPIIYTIDF